MAQQKVNAFWTSKLYEPEDVMHQFMNYLVSPLRQMIYKFILLSQEYLLRSKLSNIDTVIYIQKSLQAIKYQS